MEGQSLLQWEEVVYFLVCLTQRLPSNAQPSIKVFCNASSRGLIKWLAFVLNSAVPS